MVYIASTFVTFSTLGLKFLFPLETPLSSPVKGYMIACKEGSWFKAPFIESPVCFCLVFSPLSRATADLSSRILMTGAPFEFRFVSPPSVFLSVLFLAPREFFFYIS